MLEQKAMSFLKCHKLLGTAYFNCHVVLGRQNLNLEIWEVCPLATAGPERAVLLMRQATTHSLTRSQTGSFFHPETLYK